MIKHLITLAFVTTSLVLSSISFASEEWTGIYSSFNKNDYFPFHNIHNIHNIQKMSKASNVPLHTDMHSSDSESSGSSHYHHHRHHSRPHHRHHHHHDNEIKYIQTSFVLNPFNNTINNPGYTIQTNKKRKHGFSINESGVIHLPKKGNYLIQTTIIFSPYPIIQSSQIDSVFNAMGAFQFVTQKHQKEIGSILYFDGMIIVSAEGAIETNILYSNLGFKSLPAIALNGVINIQLLKD